MRELLREPQYAAEKGRLKIVKLLMARPGTQSDLVQRSSFVPSTVSNVVNEFSDRGIIEFVGEQKTGKLVRLRPLTGVAVGIELGYRYTVIVARQAHQPRTDARYRQLNVGAVRGTRSWLDSLLHALQELVVAVGDSRDDIATVGLAIPRMVSPIDQSLTPPVLPPWRDGENPASLLTQALRESAASRGEDLSHIQVRLDNDAMLGAYAESVYAFPHAETLVFVKASTGVGAGIMIGGTMFRGAGGGAGEIGHMMIQPRGRFCSCGGRGCLETLIGGDALMSNARTVLGEETFDAPNSIDELVRKARDGNPVCGRVVSEAGTQLGYAVGGLCNLINPNVVVLGGALGRAGDLVLEPCQVGIRRSAMAATYGPGFLLTDSKLEHGTAHGALMLGIDGEGV
jgi:predicted NBD/HSP70 family sugar kinase